MDLLKFKTTWGHIKPPGFYRGYVPGKDNSESITVDVFDNHRFLFYSLATYTEKRKPLTLISLDYHQDLAPISDHETLDLRALNLDDIKEVAFFCWNHINPLNDSHILSAVYLGMIQDVFILCKDRDEVDVEYKDMQEVNHKVKSFRSETEFLKAIKAANTNIAFDIDLDYFIDRQDGDGNVFSELHDDRFSVIDCQSDLLQSLYGKIKLLTIAKEPEHCGGTLISNRIFQIVHDKLFNGHLLARNKFRAKLILYDKYK
jgi:hypothetical protein